MIFIPFALFTALLKFFPLLKLPCQVQNVQCKNFPILGLLFFLDSVAIFRTLRRTSRKLTGLRRKHRTERGPWPPNHHYPTKRTFPFYPPPFARHTAATFKTIRLTSFPPTKLWAGMSKGHRAGQWQGSGRSKGNAAEAGAGAERNDRSRSKVSVAAAAHETARKVVK